MDRNKPEWIAVAVAIAAILFIFLTSCEVFHKMSGSKSSDADLKKNDSTHVKKSESGSESESYWQRKTWLFDQQPRRDTINNIVQLQPKIEKHYSTQPIMYIEESGRNKERVWNIDLDSFKRVMLDSLHSTESKKETTTKGEVLSTMQIIGLLCIAVVVAVILGKLKISIK